MDVGGIIGSTEREKERERERERERKKNESAPPPPCKSQQPAVSQPPKPLGLFFFLPFTPLKKSDSGTRHNI